eukprot:6243967-Prorocentrum_lima.AAC.1
MEGPQDRRKPESILDSTVATNMDRQTLASGLAYRRCYDPNNCFVDCMYGGREAQFLVGK